MHILKRAVAETIGSAFLLAIIIGSGIMGERLAGGNIAIALLANSVATGAALAALILALSPISGAHFNPLVSIAAALQARLPWRDVPAYMAAQLAGAFAGVAAAHLMFSEPVFLASQHTREGFSQVWSECVATFGLLIVILGCARQSLTSVSLAVGGYISAAYWFTASTCFANPAVTLARSASNTFAGIRPDDVPGFLLGQLTGAALALMFWHFVEPISGEIQGAEEERD
ncbi:MAG TPA: MIP/aquaporin family protein [Burkholderiales bacterium]|nr:MIP/aquaporin family protein [Burkholderiales bacterium]